MSDLSNNSESQRSKKRVRKGTRSCWECKRRKIKCIFASENDHICAECLDRGTHCLSQEYADHQSASTGSRLGQRMGRVEQLLEQLMETIQSNNGGGKQLQPPGPTPPLKESNHSNDILTPLLTPGQYETAPIMSMFNNNVISRDLGRGSLESPPQGSYSNIPTPNSIATVPVSRAQAKINNLRGTLLSLLPSQHDVDVLTGASCGWWLIKRDVILSGFDISQLDTNTPPEHLMNRYLSSVQALITSDDELVCTIEGIECLILLGVYNINSGNLRRSWLIFRRALNVSQLMGLHRAQNAAKDSYSLTNIRAKYLWYQVVKCDRYLAMILGLPSGTKMEAFSANPEDSQSLGYLTVEDRYHRKLCDIAGMILERNSSEDMQAYAATQEVDEALENLRLSMPGEWWEIPAFAEVGKSQVAAEQFDRLLAHIWHLQLEALTHLPFMLRAVTERRYEYSRFSCLKASRATISRWLFMRSSNPHGFVCHIVDFQAFTCSVTLLLGILGPSIGGHEEEKQRHEDKKMVDEVLHVLHRLRRYYTDKVTDQSVEVLKTLLGVIMHPDALGNLCLTIPYFGTINVNSVARETASSSAASHLLSQQPQSHQPDLEQWQQLHATPHQQPGSTTQSPLVSFQSSQFQDADMGNWTFPDEDMMLFDNLSNFDVTGNWKSPIEPFPVQSV